MQPDQLAEELGYAERGDNWVTDADAGDHLLRAAWKAGVTGAYLFRTSPDGLLPPRPAVFIAQADSEDEAREIHRRLWNLGSAPFLIVILPHQVRVYKGFMFDRQSGRSDVIVECQPRDADILAALKCFHADEIDSGRVWESQAGNVSLSTRVDRDLLRNLNNLGECLVREKHLAIEVAHSLIGKYIYITYLHHRDILSDQWLLENRIDLGTVLGHRATREGLLGLVQAIEKRFNGRIFPLDPAVFPDDDAVGYVASVFGGVDAVSGQMALDFKAYDFSFIPIELLSAIYEQFLLRLGGGKSAGEVYTPETVAGYLLSEVNATKQLTAGLTVLDPCCGSGIFLVLAYRRLIEMERKKRQGAKLTPIELRSILTGSIYGVETNSDACNVTELSLILTLLSYVDPPDLHYHKDFHFPVLRNSNIFEADFFDDESAFWKRRLRFDWVVGNPPWVELDPTKEENRLAVEWIRRANLQGRPVARYRACDAFSWRVTDVLKRDGCVGLLTHAKSLTNEQCTEYRRAFFQQHAVRRVTNFSNLAYVLFEGRAEAPAATLVYTRCDPQQYRPPIIHFGPFVANQVQTRSGRTQKERAWAIAICESEVSTVDPDEAAKGSGETWKLALWGTYRDARILGRLEKLFQKRLGSLIRDRGWRLAEGVELRAHDAESVTSGKIVSKPELARIPMLDIPAMRGSGFRLTIPPRLLDEIPQTKRYIRARGGSAGLEVASAPHLFLTTDFAAYSDLDFILTNPRISLAAREEDADYLRAISVLLNSSILRYLLFFKSSAWGVDRTRLMCADLESVWAPQLDEGQVASLAALHRKLACEEESGVPSSLFAEPAGTATAIPAEVRLRVDQELDDEVARILDVPASISTVIKEFWSVRYKLNKGNVGGVQSGRPSRDVLRSYAACLMTELERFSGVSHRVTVDAFADFIVCTVEITDAKRAFDPVVTMRNENLSCISHPLSTLLRAQASQWAYVQRGLRVFDGGKLHIYKPSRLLDWTQTQATLDSDDVVAEVLASRGPAPCQ